MSKSHSHKEAQKKKREAQRDEQRKAAQRKNAAKRTTQYIMYSVVILIAIGIIVTLMQTQTVSTANLEELSLTAVADTDVTQGNGSNIIIIEYSDYECPACKSAEPLVKELLDKYGDDITFIYRDYPLKQIHPKATIAAQAAQAAGVQGKYWEMHDLLFENQAQWAQGDHKALFTQFAESLELNVTQFEDDLESDNIRAIVQNNYESGLKYGVSGTPTFFFNGRQIKVSSIADFERRIQAIAR